LLQNDISYGQFWSILAGGAYILVHQAGLANTAIAQDDNLFHSNINTQGSGRFLAVFASYRTLRRTFFREDMVNNRL
jgi:hypothetical protein